MKLSPGASLGHYEVVSVLGAGGMGEVFRARDSRLGRDVAVKVLPDSFAHDPDRLARFEREAQVLASLNHPNIATVHGFEHAGETRAIVMELVEGPTLADQIAEGPIAIDEALAIARQIVDALDAAHGQGVVHRDLKPANIKVRSDGAVKVLDFGLAKASGPEGRDAAADAMNSPTLTAAAFARGSGVPGTQMGMIIGTAAYMSPEQARGRAVDRRADIWAFGCVLYEMVTGKRLFLGEDLTETLASVVKENPSLEQAPPGLQKLLRRCLEKDPKKRLRDIGDAWDLLETAGAPAAAAHPAVASRWSFVPWIAASVAAIAAVALAIMVVRRPGVVAPTVAFELGWPGDADARFVGGARFFEISPDSRHVAIVHQNALWVRALDAVTPVRIERTQGATYPFWSPDSGQIAFFQNSQLKVVPRAGGSPRTICDAANARGGTWNPQGTIVFAGDYGAGGLLRVADQGGTPAKVTTLDGQGPTAAAHRYPQFLPDGNRFLYLSLAPDRESAGVFIASLDGMTPVRILASPDNARFSRAQVDGGDGHLLFVRGDTLMAQVFDSARLAMSGAPFPVATGVGQGENTGLGAFSVADNGMLAHAEGIVAAFDLRWIARTGEPREVVTPDVPSNSFAVAPDQKRVAMGLASNQGGFNFDVWVQSPGAAPAKFTFGPAPGWIFPVWSPTGDRIAYASIDLAGQPAYEIRLKASNMAGVEETLFKSNAALYLWDWSPDGKYIVFSNNGDVFTMPLDGARKPVAFTKGPDDDQYAQVSPNGRWMAYASGPRGAMQIYVQPIPPTGALWQVSQRGGSMPRWRADGKELYYRADDGSLIAVAVPDPHAAAFSFSTAQSLIAVPSLGNVHRYAYEPAPDGSRFLVSVPSGRGSPPITVVLNWRRQ
jgi:Tol biopolymer transport system component